VTYADADDERLAATLLVAVEEAVTLLRAHREERWAEWLERGGRLVAAGDGYGVEHLLRAFGGMGSLNDLVLGRDDDAFWELRERIWESARALQPRGG
jgi:hypothetical protein